MRTGASGAIQANGLNGSEDPVLVSWADAPAQWCSLSQRCGETNVFHSERWTQVLEQAYSFELSLAAPVERSGEFRAALPLARSKNPFRRAMIALPFSDSAPQKVQVPRSRAQRFPRRQIQPVQTPTGRARSQSAVHFFSKKPSQVSSEHIDGTWRIAQQLSSQWPTALTCLIGSAV
jgi:hypothetical protein